MRRILAVLLSFSMILGTAATAYADDTLPSSLPEETAAIGEEAYVEPTQAPVLTDELDMVQETLKTEATEASIESDETILDNSVTTKETSFTLYAVCENTIHGKVLIDLNGTHTDLLDPDMESPVFTADTAVDFTVSADEGYVIDTFKVTDEYMTDVPYEITNEQENKYRVTIQDKDIFIRAEFKESEKTVDAADDIDTDNKDITDKIDNDAVAEESDVTSTDVEKNTETTSDKAEESSGEAVKDSSNDDKKDIVSLFTVKIADTKNGSVMVNGGKTARQFKEGDKVYLTVKPDKGYKVQDVFVIDNDENLTEIKKLKVSYTDSEDLYSSEFYSFTCPSSNVTVEAYFEEDNESDDNNISFKIAGDTGTIDLVKGDAITFAEYATDPAYAFDYKFTMDGTYEAFCAFPWQRQKETGTYSFDGYGYLSDRTLVKVLYYGYGGGGYDKGMAIFAAQRGLSYDQQHVITHFSVASVYNGGADYYGLAWNAHLNDTGIILVNQYKEFLATVPDVSGTVLTLYGASADEQDIIALVAVDSSTCNISLKKESTVKTDLSLNGAVFGVYNNEQNASAAITAAKSGKSSLLGTEIGYFKTDASGTGITGAGETSITGLALGQYWIVELKAPDGFKGAGSCYWIDTENLNYSSDTLGSDFVTRTESGLVATYALRTVDIPYGKISIVKKSAAESITTDNPCYSLKGAVYGIYTKQQQKDKYLVGTITTDAKGKGSLTGLDFGTYYVKEITASKGYDLDDTWYEAVISSSALTVNVTSTEPVNGDPFSIELEKNGFDYALGNEPSSLSGTQFELTYYSGDYKTKAAGEKAVNNGNAIKRTWTLKIKKSKETGQYRCRLDRDYLVSGSDELYVNKEDVYIPEGTLFVEETAPAKGYTLDGAYFKLYDGTMVNGTSWRVYIDGEGALQKAVGGNTLTVYNGLARTDFELVKTDSKTGSAMANVSFSITNKETNESFTFTTDENGCYSSKSTVNSHSSENGMWFGESDPDDTKGALVTGTYVLKELRTKYNAGKVMITKEFTVTDESPEIISISLANDDVAIKTEASGDDGKYIFAYKDAVISDKANITGLTKGVTYTLIGALMFKDGTPVTDENKEAVTVTKSFIATDPSETVTVTFSIDATKLGGKEIVCFETLYEGDLEVASHADLNDSDQTVKVKTPEIGTTAVNKATGHHQIAIDKETTVTDTVAYKDLKPGATYILKGVLKDKLTGEIYKDADGKEITSEISFTASDSGSGTVDVEFTFMPNENAGSVLVASESLFVGDVKIAEHDDLNDTDQMIYIAEISSALNGKETGDKTVTQSEEAVVTDTVTYKNLSTDVSYKINSYLVESNTGEKIEESEKTTVFTPESSDGSIDIDMTFDSTKYKGGTVTAFQYLIDNDYIIAHDDDKDNALQQVQIPDIHTTALDTATGTHTGHVSDSVTISDECFFENLIPGKEYTLKAALYNRNTEEVLEGTEKEVTFVPEEKNGSYTVTWEIDASALAGESITATETLLYNGVELAVHFDLTDDDQTVRFPRIDTTATDGETKCHIGTVGEESFIYDDVTYENLISGNYVVRGYVADASTGEPILINNERIISEEELINDESEGTITLKFSLPTDKYAGETLVIYEEIIAVNEDTKDEVVVTSHKVKDDESQSVHYPKVTTEAMDATTQHRTGHIADEVVITDEIAYKNAIPGEEYTIKGSLYDVATGKQVTYGKTPCEDEITFTADESSGSVSLKYTMSSEDFKGGKTVCYAYMYHEDVLVYKSDDPSDVLETVEFPDIHTTALDKDTGTHAGRVSETAVVTDEVFYTGLTAGKTYTIDAQLYIKSTEKVLKGTKKTVELIPKEPDGSIVITWTIDSTLLAGDSVVATESIKYNDIELITHKDLNDEDQTVSYPRIITAATDGNSATHVGTIGSPVTVKDTVDVKNLAPGRYIMEGVMVSKISSQPIIINGQEVTAYTEFENTGYEESVELTFVFENTEELAGTSVVAFETLKAVNEETGVKTAIAEEKDADNSSQTVNFPKINTSAIDSKSKAHNGTRETDAEIIDTVSYENLLCDGTEYKISGVLIDKSTGQPLLINGKQVTAEKTFIPKETSGKVEVTFRLDSSDLGGVTVVVFEDLLVKGPDAQYRLVCSHSDLNDTDQSIYYRGDAPATGDDAMPWTPIAVSAAALAASLSAYLKRKNTD